jgi:hypothetical protein
MRKMLWDLALSGFHMAKDVYHVATLDPRDLESKADVARNLALNLIGFASHIEDEAVKAEYLSQMKALLHNIRYIEAKLSGDPVPDPVYDEGPIDVGRHYG